MCRSAWVSLISPVCLASFLLAPPSCTPAGATKMLLWGCEELPELRQNYLHDSCDSLLPCLCVCACVRVYVCVWWGWGQEDPDTQAPCCVKAETRGVRPCPGSCPVCPAPKMSSHA